MATYKIASFEVVDHGEDGSQYFPGCGVAYTAYSHVATGVGDTGREALEGVLEMLSQTTESPEVTPEQEAEMLAAINEPDLDCHADCDPEWHDSGEEHDWHRYVSIRYTLARIAPIARTSGYTTCACRDCFEVAVADDSSEPVLCWECAEVGCDPTGQSECYRENAYGQEE